MACRGGVAAGAVTATLICACRVRRSVAGRMVPLTSTGNHQGAHRGDGDRSCHGERPARRRLGGHRGPGQAAVISARTNPASSRATAVAASGAALAGVQQVQVPGVQAPLRLPQPGQGLRGGAGLAAGQSRADRRGAPAGPGRLGQRGADRLGAGLGDVPAADPLPGGIPGGDQPGEAHERPGGRETGASPPPRRPATARSARRCPGNSPAGPPPAPAARGPPTGPARPRSRPVRPPGPGGWPGSTRSPRPAPARRTAARRSRTGAPPSSTTRPARCARAASAPRSAAAGPACGHPASPRAPAPGPAPPPRPGPGPAPASAPRPSPAGPAAANPVRLDLVRAPLGDQRRRLHLARHPYRGQQPVQLITPRPGLIPAPQHRPVREPADQPPDRRLLIWRPAP